MSRKIYLISSMIGEDSFDLQRKIKEAEAIYKIRLDEYNASLKTKDNLKINAEFVLLKNIESSLNRLKNDLEKLHPSAMVDSPLLNDESSNFNISGTSEEYIPNDPNASSFAADPVSAVAEAVGSLADMLPKIGIGTKSRQKEIKAASDANVSIIDAQTKQQEKEAKQKRQTYVIIGVGVFLTMTVAGVLFARK